MNKCQPHKDLKIKVNIFKRLHKVVAKEIKKKHGHVDLGACDTWQKKRLDVKPGITCIWQVFGRSAVSFVEWMRMDLRYIRKYSLRFDLKLLFRTVWTVLRRKGASSSIDGCFGGVQMTSRRMSRLSGPCTAMLW